MYRPGQYPPSDKAHYVEPPAIAKPGGGVWLPPLGCECNGERNAKRKTCHLESLLYGDRRRWCAVKPSKSCKAAHLTDRGDFAYCVWRKWDKSEDKIKAEDEKASKALMKHLERQKEAAHKRREANKVRVLWEQHKEGI